MNRSIIYTQEQPRTFDILNGWRDALIAAGYLQQDLAGNTTTVVTGFAATPSSPASLVLNLTAGRIYELSAADATQYGSLPNDTDLIMQQGLAAAQTVTLTTAALSAGQSQWALIEVSFGQVDVIRANDPTGGVLYYWNSANPTVPFQGPNGDGQTQPTEREGVASIQVIYGSPVTTGSEVPPTPSIGYVPLYLIDLAFGQTSVTSGQIIVAGPAVGANVPGNYPYAPFLAGLLSSHHGAKPGQAPQIKMAELANVSSSATGSGLASMYSYAGNPNGHVAGVAAVAGVSPADLCIDVANNLLYFCSTTGNAAAAVWNPASGQAVNFVGGTSTGLANAQVVTPVSPAGFSLVAGYSITFTPGIANTGATMLAVSGTAATACRKVSGGVLVAFAGNEFIANVPVTMAFNGTYWVLQVGVLGATAFLNLGQWTQNDGSGNLTLTVEPSTLADNGSGSLAVAGPYGMTGTAILTLATSAPTGWLMMDDGTLGSTSSGATHQGTTFQALYNLLWNNISNTYAPTYNSSGTPVARGASAAADWAANNRIGLTLQLGRALCIAGAGAGLTSRALGTNLGEETHLLTTPEMPSHTHTIGISVVNTVTNQPGLGNNGGGPLMSTNATGGDGAHNNMQPSAFWNIMIKL